MPENNDSAKLRGGYYTAPPIAQWLTSWAVRSPKDRILEPSCGDGSFLEAIGSRMSSAASRPKRERARVVGVELNAGEAAKARKRVARFSTCAQFDVVTGDFFDWVSKEPSEQFDAVIGNPPFIRYQSFPEPSRSRAMGIMHARGLRPNRLTNTWVPFIVASMDRLRDGGRLAMVVPAELLQVGYAAQLRQFLASSFSSIRICACNEMLFKDAEQEVVLLLADGKLPATMRTNACQVSFFEAPSVENLLGKRPDTATSKGAHKVVQHSTEKWLKYLLDPKEIELMRILRAHPGIGILGDHGSVDVGVVTGKNEFFVLTQEQVRSHELSKFVVPVVGRSSQLQGAVIGATEHRALAKAGKPVFLLNLVSELLTTFTSNLRRLIAAAESQGMHLGYKCRVRDPWYAVPSAWDPDCFLFRQIYDFPRIVVNKAGATSTDTIHRFRSRSPAARVAANFYTHLTAASSEIEGRSYGGGVLELEPTEAERLLVPKVLNGAMPIGEVDSLVRSGRLASVLEHNDHVVLRNSLGLSKPDCAMLKRIWTKMRDRRANRRRRTLCADAMKP